MCVVDVNILNVDVSGVSFPFGLFVTARQVVMHGHVASELMVSSSEQEEDVDTIWKLSGLFM